VDPLEIVFTREVMRRSIVALPVDATIDRVEAALTRSVKEDKPQRLFPVVDAAHTLLGVVTRTSLRQWIRQPSDGARSLAPVMQRRPVVAHDDEPLRMIAFRMAETGLTRLPVVDRSGHVLLGIVSLTDLLGARARILEAERRRERVLGTRLRLKAVLGRDTTGSVTTGRE
jgi:CBS domain-containing protein